MFTPAVASGQYGLIGAGEGTPSCWITAFGSFSSSEGLDFAKRRTLSVSLRGCHDEDGGGGETKS